MYPDTLVRVDETAVSHGFVMKTKIFYRLNFSHSSYIVFSYSYKQTLENTLCRNKKDLLLYLVSKFYHLCDLNSRKTFRENLRLLLSISDKILYMIDSE